MNSELVQDIDYIGDIKKLAEAIEVLGSHYEEAKNFYWSTSLTFQINMHDAETEKLKKLFIVANRERRGFSEESLGIAVSEFSLAIETTIEAAKDKDPRAAHRDFLSWLCSLTNTEQKTANLFLKWVIMFAEELKLKSLDWLSWREYLDVPLDRWVVRLLGEHLKVGTTLFHKDFLNPKGTIPGALSQGYSKYAQLQGELERVAHNTTQPKIVLDELWIVGHVFDIYRPWLCEQCWIRSLCQHERKQHAVGIPTPP